MESLFPNLIHISPLAQHIKHFFQQDASVALWKLFHAIFDKIYKWLLLL